MPESSKAKQQTKKDVAKKKAATKAKSKKPTQTHPPASGRAATPLPVPLTKEQKFYIEGNMEVLSVDQMAADLKLGVADVRAHCDLARQTKGPSRASNLMQRPARGVVAMTEAASMASDDFKKRGVITQSEINRAAAEGNYKLAAELAEKRSLLNTDDAAQNQARYGHCWHFITPPEPSPDGKPK